MKFAMKFQCMYEDISDLLKLNNFIVFISSHSGYVNECCFVSYYNEIGNNYVEQLYYI